MVQAFNLSGQRVAITGAGGGIGSETARLVASMGADVMVADLEAPEPLADYLRSQGKVSVATALNTTDRKAVEAWAETCGEVDALIDCAAICPFDDWNDDGWDEVTERVFNVNLQGPLNVTRAFFPGMVTRKKGSIALVGSIAGRIGGVRAAPHYAMSKGGIHAFVHWFSRRGAPHNVTINAVAPGPVATPMTQGEDFQPETFPMGRMAQAEEIAGPLAFLISPSASYINGAVLDINGAMHFS